MKNFRKVMWGILVFCTMVQKASGSDTLTLSNNNIEYGSYAINSNVYQLFVDSSLNGHSIAEITAPSFQENFKPIPFPSNPNPAEKKTYWVKATVKNNGAKSLKWLLIQGDPSVGEFEFYAPMSKGNYSLIGSDGLSKDFNKRLYSMISLVYDLPLDSGECKTFYFKFSSTTDFSYKLVIQNTRFSINYFLQEYFYLGFYYGLLILMAVYNLILFFSIKDKIYLYYFFYVIATSLLNSINDKIAFQFIWASFPIVNTVLFYLAHPLFMLLVALYTTAFLELKKFDIRYVYAVYGATLLIILYRITDIIWFHSGIESYSILVQYLLIYYVAFKRYRLGYKPTRFFLLGFTFVLMGITINLLAIKAFLPANVFTVYAFNFGIIIEIIILSVAIGDRIKFIQKSKDEADKQLIAQLQENEVLKTKLTIELEEKVKERTAYIEIQAAEIKRMNELLKEDNTKLSQNVTKLSQSRVLQEDITLDEFRKIYPDEEACYKLLEGLKWKNGFVCRKCQCTTFSNGNSQFARKCTKCRTIESVTAHTLLHAVKFSIDKALYIVLVTTNNASTYTNEQLSETLDLRRATCWTFQNKVKQRIASLPVPKKGKLNWIDLIVDSPTKS